MWFALKKREMPISSDFSQIHSNLQTSFTRIKGDVQAIRDWLAYFKDREQDHERRLNDAESRIEELSEVLAYMQESQEIQQTPLETDQVILIDDAKEQTGTTQIRIIDDLTDTQKSIFYRLGTLLQEAGQEWMTSKSLAQDLYPDKPYDVIRSTLSEYTSILIEAGLIKKRRKGKLTYLSMAEKGSQIFSQTKKPRLKKVIVNKKT